MARNDLISKLYAKKGTALEFNYDSLMAPPLASLIPMKDLEYMNKLVTSIKYTSKIDYKESEIKKVMNCYGFQRYASGTHRVVYRHLDIPTIIAKISLNKSSLGDNLREMQNQYYLKPFCTKVFDVYPTGLIGLFERVEPFQSRDEFISVAGDIFDFINTKIIGKYVVDDIGTASFMNYGIRKAGPYSDVSFGPVLLDFTEVFPLDGDTSMKRTISRGGRVIKSIDSEKMGTDTIQPPKKSKEIVGASQMDMVGTAIGRSSRKRVNAIKITPSLEGYDASNDDAEEKENIFCGGHKRPVEEVKEQVEETPVETTEEPVEKTIPEYNTDTGFIPPKEEVSEPVDAESVETEPTEEVAEETTEDENPVVYSSEPVETETVDPEDELGGSDEEAVDPEDELGEQENISIDPAAIAASMMGNSNPFIN